MPLIITATAPVRTCDCGGWTDTWFARRGAVFHVAVNPGVRVVVCARTAVSSGPDAIVLHAENYGDRYALVPGRRPWVRHPLLEAAIESVGLPAGVSAEIEVGSAVPPGASTGTSAAVCVALVGALRALAGMSLDPDAVAAAAHAVEVDLLGLQSGLQDQLAAAHGGVNFVEILEYPSAVVHPIELAGTMRSALDRQLLLVYVGRTHSSSAIHEDVIRGLAGLGAGAGDHPALAALRDAARAARDAARAGDLAGLGAAMRANTDAQRRLHPALVGSDAQRLISLAREHGALGWKVNGAGGEGGSLAILAGPDPGPRARLESAIAGASHAYLVIPTTIARRGLDVSMRKDAGEGM
jgi:D-glycero-alpha-D-manno-heptose-7-phosphate kinase